jgi:hypothetical protein
MEIGARVDLFGLLDEGDAVVGDFCVELLDGCNVLIDDRLIDKRPKCFCRLQLGTIGRQINKANTLWDFEIGRPMPPRIVPSTFLARANQRFALRFMTHRPMARSAQTGR